MLEYVGITREMISETIVGRKVFRTEEANRDENPRLGTVVAGNIQTGTLWVSFDRLEDPVRLQINRLYLVKNEMKLEKAMSWAGKTLGSLEKFIEQLRVEGGDEDTVLNPQKPEHLHIAVALPLATNSIGDKTRLIADDKVVGEVSS